MLKWNYNMDNKMMNLVNGINNNYVPQQIIIDVKPKLDKIAFETLAMATILPFNPPPFYIHTYTHKLGILGREILEKKKVTILLEQSREGIISL